MVARLAEFWAAEVSYPSLPFLPWGYLIFSSHSRPPSALSRLVSVPACFVLMTKVLQITVSVSATLFPQGLRKFSFSCVYLGIECEGVIRGGTHLL